MTDRIQGWHFVGDKLRDGRPVPADGEVLTHDGKVIPCRSGLHGSERLIDALKYAPGNTICRVEAWGDVLREDDKFAVRNRVILWRVDGEALLRQFAREQALSVAHLWDMPAIVREYLGTDDETKRAAEGAARAAAWDAAWDAARVHAGAARDAAWAAAWDAANTRLTELVETAHATGKGD